MNIVITFCSDKIASLVVAKIDKIKKDSTTVANDSMNLSGVKKFLTGGFLRLI